MIIIKKLIILMHKFLNFVHKWAIEDSIPERNKCDCEDMDCFKLHIDKVQSGEEDVNKD